MEKSVGHLAGVALVAFVAQVPAYGWGCVAQVEYLCATGGYGGNSWCHDYTGVHGTGFPENTAFSGNGVCYDAGC